MRSLSIMFVLQSWNKIYLALKDDPLSGWQVEKISCGNELCAVVVYA